VVILLRFLLPEWLKPLISFQGVSKMALKRDSQTEAMIQQVFSLAVSNGVAVAAITRNKEMMKNLSELNVRINLNWDQLMDILIGPKKSSVFAKQKTAAKSK
jgi:hypothetical protein